MRTPSFFFPLLKSPVPFFTIRSTPVLFATTPKNDLSIIAEMEKSRVKKEMTNSTDTAIPASTAAAVATPPVAADIATTAAAAPRMPTAMMLAFIIISAIASVLSPLSMICPAAAKISRTYAVISPPRKVASFFAYFSS